MSYTNTTKNSTKRTFVIPTTFTVDPSTTVSSNLLTTNDIKTTLIIKKIYLSFPAATYYELEVYFTINNKKLPETPLAGDNESFEIPVNESISPTQGLIINIKNTSTTDTHTVNVIVLAEV